LNAAVTREVVRIHTAHVGRGPRKSSSFHNGNVMITVMDQMTTHAEQNLASNGEREAVLAMRQIFQRTMAEELRTAVERLTQRTVVAVMGDNHLDPDMAIEVFILDSPLT
jgi:uncharacterized protein YbcI